MKKPLNRAKAAQDRLTPQTNLPSKTTKTKNNYYKHVVDSNSRQFDYLSDAFTNKPLEEDGQTAQDMLLKYEYVETLDEFADGIRTHDNLNTSQPFL